MTTPQQFFKGNAQSKKLFDAIASEVEKIGLATVRISKSQIAFRRRRNFAIVWMPGQYLEGPVAPLVLTLSFAQKDKSPRWKEVVKIAPKRYTHHLELRNPEEVDAEVKAWLRSGWEAA